ncbi:MAG: hypothetical protein H7Y20_04025 [Bryobacteraceae bacterium]|nr:hypothetical protein [Bryobacteraceae bacterium]
MKSKPVRILLATVAVVGVVYVLAVGGLYAAMLQPPEKFGAIMAHVPMPAMMVLPFRPLWMSARAGKAGPGGMAPDFHLESVDGKRTVTLSEEYRSKPVVLVFGSYT